MKKAERKNRFWALAVFAIAAVIGLGLHSPAKASAATKCYTIGTANVTVYSNTGLSKKYGAIYPSDQITVLNVTDRYCKVNYPISRGTKTGYISTGKILTKTTGSSYKSRAKITTYRRANSSATYGYIATGDTVKVLGASGSYTQVKYPVSGGYKYAFITTTALKSYILPNTPSSTPKVTPSSLASGKTYQLVSALNNRYVMDVAGGSYADGGNVQLYENNGSNAQKFKFVRQSDGYYTITNVNSGKLLDCCGAGRTKGTNINQCGANGTAAQRWKVTSVGGGYYKLICKCNGLAVDVTGARVANDTNIQMYTDNGTAAQKWMLVATTASSPAVSSNKAQQIVNYELSQLGVGERGNNNVIYNTWYYGRTISGSGYPWCMAFQSYCANQLGVLNTAIPKTASCAVAVNWYKSRGQFQYAKSRGGSYTPKAGDLVFYYSGGSFSHVGMITAPPVNGYLQTVEGNVQCSDGMWKVVRFTNNSKRTINNSYVYGYGTPTY